MPFAESATLFSRSRESGPPPEEPEFPGPAQYWPCLQILKAMNRIMAEHFGIPPGPEKRLARGGGGNAEKGRGFVPASALYPTADPGVISTLRGVGPTGPEGSCRHE